jgi:uncharacterized tellurite resistance protein B-like protein
MLADAMGTRSRQGTTRSSACGARSQRAACRDNWRAWLEDCSSLPHAAASSLSALGTAMNESRDYLELTFRSVSCFGNDGRLDAAELDHLIAIAERDGRIDANEMRVLKNIIDRIRPDEIDAAMKARLEALSAKLREVKGGA